MMHHLHVAATLFALTAAPLEAQDLQELLERPLPGSETASLARADARGAPQPASNSGFRYDAREKLEFHARDMHVRDVFQQLRLLTRRNIVVASDVDATFSGDLYDMEFEQALDAVCLSTGLVATPRDGYLFIENAMMDTRVFTLRYARAADVIEMISPLLEEGEKAGASQVSKQGVQSSAELAGGDDYAHEEVLFVRAMPRNLEHIAGLIAEVDGEPQQVLIEAVILTADMLNSHEHGVNVSALGSISFTEAGTSVEGAEIVQPPFGPTAMEEGFSRGQSNVGNGLAPGGLNFGFVRGNVAAFLRALDQVTETTVLANPKILALNKQRGEVLLGRRDGYLTTTVTQTSSTQTIEYIETGTRLIFRPFVGDDEMIRLEIHPEDSEGGINEEGLPFKETAEITTNVLLRSGQTVFIGGLFREKTEQVERKVPVLGDLPLVRHAFRSVSDLVSREEIIILLTPRIIDPDSYGIDPEPAAHAERIVVPQLRDLYLRLAKALALEGKSGSARWLLEHGAEGADSDPSVEGEVRDWLVPDYAARTVDRRFAEDLIREDEGR
jgi:type II secretory pathway component GspD/PulD (secretin)